MDADLLPRPRRAPPGHWPDFTTYYLHYPPGLRDVVRATFGAEGPDASAAIADLIRLMQGEYGANSVERGRVMVPAEPATQVVFGYWPDVAVWQRFLARGDVQAWLAAQDTPRWRETGIIPLTHNETHFGNQIRQTGLGRIAGTTHQFCPMAGYWGAARDRIPAAADDDLAPGPGLHNLCTIRTSQDWIGAPADHVDWYMREVEPVLRAGATYLHDHGVDARCLAVRYIRETDLDGNDVPRTCVLAHFRSLDALEDWAQNHPSHLAIFDAAMALVRQFGESLGIRLFHEVSVFPAGRFDSDYTRSVSDVRQNFMRP